MATFGTGYDPSLMLLLNQQGGQGMANALTGKVKSGAKKVESDLEKAQREFLQAIQAGELQYDPTVDAATAQQRMAGSFSGPNSLFDSPDFDPMAFINQASDVERDASLLGSSGGILELLQQQYGAPAVTDLDVALAQHAGGKQFGQLRDEYGNLIDEFGNVLAETEQEAWEARLRSAANAQKYRALFEQLMAQQQAAQPPPFVPGAPPTPSFPSTGGGTYQPPPIQAPSKPVYSPGPAPKPAPATALKPAAKPAPKPAPKKPAPKPAPKPTFVDPRPAIREQLGKPKGNAVTTKPKPKAVPKKVSTKKPTVIGGIKKPGPTALR